MVLKCLPRAAGTAIIYARGRWPVREHHPGLVAGWLSGDQRARAQRHIETCAERHTLAIELARDADVEATGARLVRLVMPDMA